MWPTWDQRLGGGGGGSASPSDATRRLSTQHQQALRATIVPHFRLPVPQKHPIAAWPVTSFLQTSTHRVEPRIRVVSLADQDQIWRGPQKTGEPLKWLIRHTCSLTIPTSGSKARRWRAGTASQRCPLTTVTESSMATCWSTCSMGVNSLLYPSSTVRSHHRMTLFGKSSGPRDST